jgi:phosphoribosylformylglycinamidine synthase
MLLLVRSGREAAIQARFARWELHAAVIGHVTAEPVIRVRDTARIVAELPIGLLTDEVPAYDLEVQAPPPRPQSTTSGRSTREKTAADPAEALVKLLGSPNLRSRRFASRQYDSTVQGNTVLGPGHAAAVVRVEGTSTGLAITTDCNPRLVRLDPRRGAQQAVAEAVRNLACVGAEPIAVTDCLNFGNPERPLVAWQLTEAVGGLAEACRVLNVPIVSGNVSLYNEAAGRAIPPTPAVGMVGLLEDVGRVVPTRFTPGHAVVVLGEDAAELGASELLPEDERFPRFDLHSERRLALLLRELAHRGLLRSAQDVADGGLAVALAECALLGECGAILHLEGLPMEVMLFSEDQGRAVVTCDASSVDGVVELASEHQVPSRVAGHTGGDRLQVADALDLSLSELRAVWEAGT